MRPCARDAGSPSCTSGAPTRGSTRTRSGTRYPAVRPSIRLTFEGMIDPKDYLREGEDGYSLASRRLTEAMRRELLKAAGREDEIEGKARGRRQN